MNRYYIYTQIIFFSIICFGCRTTYTIEDQLLLRKGIAIAELSDQVSRVEDIIFEYSVSGSNFQVVNGKIKRSNDEINLYLYLFKNDKLYFWGLPYKFVKHPEKDVREVYRRHMENMFPEEDD